MSLKTGHTQSCSGRDKGRACGEALCSDTFIKLLFLGSQIMVIPCGSHKKNAYRKSKNKIPRIHGGEKGMMPVIHYLPHAQFAHAHCGRAGSIVTESSHREAGKASLAFIVSDSCSCGKGSGGTDDRESRSTGRPTA